MERERYRCPVTYWTHRYRKSDQINAAGKKLWELHSGRAFDSKGDLLQCPKDGNTARNKETDPSKKQCADQCHHDDEDYVGYIAECVAGKEGRSAFDGLIVNQGFWRFFGFSGRFGASLM